ncbi:uncharacterized protein Z519_04699 [Cladophialophora bantiana CBS 173.52]|uniref:Uncharacterized protein n=1 Tax=Cladophialophora bantiana (strain ATCC 10958 / CBS 173.52 / CDC B-1940 / NIH 8579) TaxID=1442370 RepID=A0A0D2G7U5_CLAB1|nr:uncharacterized protein Z519_04699 [Cladophialophora bantiana CBS 173.52]KIW94722.1 hypothetical protein Z519_04699 [Cladophialophora bantiana CBS 173.52]
MGSVCYSISKGFFLQEVEQSGKFRQHQPQNHLKDRNLLSGSLTLIIEYLRQLCIAVLWTLQCRTRASDVTEISKSLIHQALTLDFVSHTDVTFSFELRRYLDASSDDDYVTLLSDLPSHFNLVYITVQVEALLPSSVLIPTIS